MLLKQLVVGPLEVNCWIVADPRTREAMVIDPGDEPDRIAERLRQENLKPALLFCTHAHFDHVGAVPELHADLGVEVVLHRRERPVYDAAHQLAGSWGFDIGELPPPGRLVEEGDEVAVGGLRFRVIHTPGHSPGGCCLLGEGRLFSGDTLFAGSIGRTDLPGGSYETIMTSLARLAELPEETEVHPGHGPSSTIGRERRMNPYLGGL